jgi:hypothetical protein
VSFKRIFLVSSVAAFCAGLASAQRPSDPPKGFARLSPGVGQIPNRLPKDALITYAPVQIDLKMTPLQIEYQESLFQKRQQQIKRAIATLRQDKKGARSKEALEARKAAHQGYQTDVIENLTPAQRTRLDQIELQVQNAMAFDRPDVQKQLDLSQSQIEQIRTIAAQSRIEIERASDVRVDIKPKDGSDSPTMEDVRAFVRTPQFVEARRKTAQNIRLARAAMMDRVASVLNASQNAQYQKMLGEQFDVDKLDGPGDDLENLTLRVAFSQGLGGQRADPNFDVTVARPAYTDTHPSVRIDEAHFNFHTSSGRYKPFARIISNDGYQVAPNRSKFTKSALKDCDILVIANALGAESMGDPGAANPAFTDQECDVVRQWIEGGGSLLLITDHAPMGSAAECLATRIGVDMSKGATRDEFNSAENRPSSLIFSRANKLLADHSITRGRNAAEKISRVQTFTGQSLKGPTGSAALLKLSDTAVDRVDGNEISAAGRVQGLAFEFGNGRVVVLGEAAMLSAQVAGNGEFKMGMNFGGIDNKQLALNIMHWLSGLLEPREAGRKKAA